MMVEVLRTFADDRLVLRFCLTILFLVVAALWFIFWRNVDERRQRLVRMMSKLPQRKGNFLLGHVLEFMGSREERFQKVIGYFRSFGNAPVIAIWIASQPGIILKSPHGAEALLCGNHSLDKSALYWFLRPWLGRGLLTCSGAKWRHTRKLITFSFHFSILLGFLEIFDRHARVLITKLETRADKGSFDVYPYLSLCTLDVICETAMRKNLNSQRDAESLYVKAVSDVTESVVFRITRPWLHFDWLYNLTSLGKKQKQDIKYLHDFTRNVIAERREEQRKENLATELIPDAEMEDGRKAKRTFLDTLLEWSHSGRGGLTDDGIREEVDTFMFAGHDTSSCALSWLLFRLSHHPDIQARIHEELDSIFGDSDRAVTNEDLGRMKYVECCIKETLRLHPPVPFFARMLKQDMEVEGYVLPAGATVSVCVYLLHRDPQQFPDPERFDPDRFAADNPAAPPRHPFAFVPFSAGPRNCIGQKFAMMEMKVLVSHVMRKFVVTGTVHPEHNVPVVSELILRPIDGMWVTLEKRRK